MGISLHGMLAGIWKERWRPKPIYRSLCVWYTHATHTMLRSISWGLGYTYHRCDLLTQTHTFFIPWKTFSKHTPTCTAHIWSNCVGGQFCICSTNYNQFHWELSDKALRTGRKWENIFWIRIHICTPGDPSGVLWENLSFFFFLNTSCSTNKNKGMPMRIGENG